MAYEARTVQSSTANALPTGTDPAVDNTSTGDVQLIKILTGTPGAVTQLDKAEDSAHSSGDTGIMALAVRQDTAAALAGSDGDYIPLIVGSDGALYVRLTQPLPAGTNAIGKLAANSGVDIGDVDVTSISAGDNLIGRFKLSDGTTVATVRELGTNDALNVAIVDGSGNQVTSFSGGGTQYAEDAVHANGDSGTLALVVRKDTAASTAGSDGDYAALVVGSDGGLWVRQSQPLPAGTNAIGKLAANDGVDIGDVTATNLPATVDTNSGNKSASTLRVVLATDQPSLSNALPASQSGTWTVQPGNTANTTAWLVKEERAATPTQSSVAGNASSASLLASNTSRKGATIYNDSAAYLYVKLGTTASTTSYTVKLAPDAYYEVPFGYTGAIDGIWASAVGNARITELA